MSQNVSSQQGGIAERLEMTRERIARAALRSGRPPEAIELIAVSKLQPLPSILEAIAAGQRRFGENYVQEGMRKRAAVISAGGPTDVRFELIGHLQRNKVRDAVQTFARIQTVDSRLLLDRLSTFVEREKRELPVLIQVNISEETTKSGVSISDLVELVRVASTLPGIPLQGLMMIGSYVAPTEEERLRRREFIRLRNLRDELERETGVPLPHLSMGMSHDFELAIEEGATIVRVGTAIFGDRP